MAISHKARRRLLIASGLVLSLLVAGGWALGTPRDPRLIGKWKNAELVIFQIGLTLRGDGTGSLRTTEWLLSSKEKPIKWSCDGDMLVIAEPSPPPGSLPPTIRKWCQTIGGPRPFRREVARFEVLSVKPEMLRLRSDDGKENDWHWVSK